MKKPKIDLSPPHMSGKEFHYIKEAFDTNWIAPVGPNVDAFEREFAKRIGVGYAAAVNSGTAAIHLALLLLNITKGDKVFCSTLTFVASANPVLYQGADPIFIDSEPDSWNMSPQALKRAMEEAANNGELPKAVIVVHLYGQSAKMDELLHICNQYDVPIIEDAAESLGTTYKGKASGTFGKFGVYSFNGNKIITTSGGGMLVSNDKKAIDRARFLASQARDPAEHYQHSVIGFNYRLSNILAGVGRAQLRVLEDRIMAKRKIFDRYFLGLAGMPGITCMPELDKTMSNRWLTTFTCNEGEAGITTIELLHALYAENIGARPVWKPLHMQPLFQDSRYYPHRDNDHEAERLFMTGICLPSGSNLTEEEQERVIKCIIAVFNRAFNRSYYILGKHGV